MTGFEKFRKKPVVIEAFFVTKKMHMDLVATKGGSINAVQFLYREVIGGEESARIVVKTLEGEHIVSAGDWIIKGIKNEIYPCKNDIFELTYDKVDED